MGRNSIHKKAIYILLALVMALCMFQLSGVAALTEGSGDGSASSASSETASSEVSCEAASSETASSSSSETASSNVSSASSEAASSASSKTASSASSETASSGVSSASSETASSEASSEKASLLSTDSDIVARGTCGADGDNLTWKITGESGKYTLTISGSGAMADYSYRNYPAWYYYNNSMTKLVLSDNITSIGDCAFFYCYGFTGSLTIPNSVKSIGDSAFRYCSGFNGNLTIGNSVESIGNSAFDDCYGFTGSLTIPDSVKSIGDSAFAGCTGFTGSLTIPDSIRSIGNYAFANCYGFTGSLTIPDSVESIGDSAFYNCTGFKGNLTIGSSVKSIGDSAFYTCTGFKGNLTIGSSVKSIGECAFCNCSGFTSSLIIPNSVENIGNSAFADCSGFAKAIIPASVTEIGDSAFCDWNTSSKIYNLSKVNMDEYNRYSGAALGTVCTVTTIVDGNIVYTTKVAGDGESKVTIADPVKENYKFDGWYTDEELKTKWVNDSIITNSTNLYAKLTVYITGSCGADGNNLTYTLDDTTLTISGSGAMKDYSYGNYPAWHSYNDSMTKLVLSDSMTSIGDSAFADCTGFTGSLTIPNSVKSIGNSAFCYCSGFNGNLTIGNSVESIGDSAFRYCDGFKGSLTIPDSVKSIGDSAFANCTGFTGNLTIPDSVKSIGGYAFYNCTGFNGNLTIGNSVESIGNRAFYNCTGFTGNLTIPDSVKSIGNYAFRYCKGFTGSLTIPDSVKSIGDGAFYECSGFAKAIIPASVTEIGISAFCDWNTSSKIYNLSKVNMDEYNRYSGAALGTVCTVKTIVDGNIASTTKVAGDGESKVTIADPVKENYKFDGWYTDEGLKTKWANDSIITNSTNLYAKLTVYITGSCGADGNDLTYTLDDTTLTISGSGAMADYSYRNYPAWHSYNNSMTKLVLSDSMTSIGNYAFADCTGFTGSLTIPNSVKSIGNYAFAYCSAFTDSLIIPNSVKSIGGYAFYNCTGFKGDLTIGSSVKSIGDSAFYNCTGFKGNLTIGNSVESIGDCAFRYCDGFKGSLTIPDSVKSIGDSAFRYCKGFTGSLTIPDSVKSIGDGAFYECSGFAKAIIPASVTDIKWDAFKNWKSGSTIYNLSNVNMDESLYSGAKLGIVYTVTTIVDGNIVSTTKVAGDGESKVTIAAPVKTDYKFCGWYANANFSKRWYSNNVVTGNLTLTAKWTHNSSSSTVSTVLPTVLTDTPTGAEADLFGAVMPSGTTSASLSAVLKPASDSSDAAAVSAYKLAVTDAKLNVIGTPVLYNLKLLDQKGDAITGFTGKVKVKLPLPQGMPGVPHVYRYEESTQTFTDMNAVVENGFIVFETDHFSYYAIAGVGDSITIDTVSYTMPIKGNYQIGIKLTGAKASSVKFYSTNNNIASVTKLKSGNYQVIGMKTGTAYIMFDVYDNKNKLLTHASVRINIKIGAKPQGDSTRQIGIF